MAIPTFLTVNENGDAIDFSGIGGGNTNGLVTQVTVPTQPSTTARKLLVIDSNRLRAYIYNNGSQTVYLGLDNTVTSSSFLFPIGAGVLLILEKEDGVKNELWGITSTGTADLKVSHSEVV